MRILHTADWHLGRMLYGRKRYEEFTAFLSWLGQVVEDEHVDVLLMAGDVFDTTTPSNRAQEMYYDFLKQVAKSKSCRHVVLIGGNHDSPSFLDAPKELLRLLDVHVVGAKQANLEDEVLVLRDSAGNPELIVGAVPYLRDQDVRIAKPGETSEQKSDHLIAGIEGHYADVGALAQRWQGEFETAGHGRVPIVGMGHLFTAGGARAEGDGVRELYVGGEAHVGRQVFPDSMDYVALGHLHVPQRVGEAEMIRYSGSPIPMGFGEAKQQKVVILVDFSREIAPQIREKPVPCFQQLALIKGNWAEIEKSVLALKATQKSVWVEIQYTGDELIADLHARLEGIAGDKIEILLVKNQSLLRRVQLVPEANETLDDLEPIDVFTRCMEQRNIPAEQRDELFACYREILRDLHERDDRAE